MQSLAVIARGKMKPQLLKKVRREMRLSQTQLAEKLGVARNTVSRWELGTRRIPEPIERYILALHSARL